MLRLTRHASLLAFALLACGCQRGQFAVASSGGGPGLDPLGCYILIVRGNGLDWFGRVQQPTQTVLCVLVLAPEVQARSVSDFVSDGLFTSQYRRAWQTDSGQVSYLISWNRHRDTVSMAGSQFDRSAGDTFILRRNSKDSWSVQQLPSVSGDADVVKALAEIKRLMPDDPLIRSLTIHET